jgi:hypothetical protein
MTVTNSFEKTSTQHGLIPKTIRQNDFISWRRGFGRVRLALLSKLRDVIQLQVCYFETKLTLGVSMSV